MGEEVEFAEKLIDKEELLAKSEVSLVLNKYDDIFSKFDPSPYSQRALSVDFLAETKRATKEINRGELELRLMIPSGQRKLEKETMIRKRLREHFKKHVGILLKEHWTIIRQGLWFVLFGIAFMFIATYILFKFPNGNLLLKFLVVALEPGGWFLFWEGLDLFIFESKKLKPDIEFYHKMSRAEIVFNHY